MFRTHRVYWVGIAIAAELLFTLAVPASADEWKLHRQSASHMGTKWHIALYSATEETANAAFRDAWNVIAEIDNDLSNYLPDSELNKLCRSAPHSEPVKVGKHLWNVVSASDALSRETAGAFDVTIGPISKLWRRARTKKTLPTTKNLAAAKMAVGYRLIELDQKKQTIRLARPKMQLDLGGIAKGYAVDLALEAVSKHGVKSALVNGGGDLAVSNAPPASDGWEVAIAGLDPTDKANGGRELVRISNAAVATSGDAWQYITIEGKRYSHLIDPHTGVGTTQRMSVTVVAPTCMAADSYASALCILPQAAGLKLVGERQFAAQLIAAKGADDEVERKRTDSFPTLQRDALKAN